MRSERTQFINTDDYILIQGYYKSVGGKKGDLSKNAKHDGEQRQCWGNKCEIRMENHLKGRASGVQRWEWGTYPEQSGGASPPHCSPEGSGQEVPDNFLICQAASKWGDQMSNVSLTGRASLPAPGNFLMSPPTICFSACEGWELN